MRTNIQEDCAEHCTEDCTNIVQMMYGTMYGRGVCTEHTELVGNIQHNVWNQSSS